MGPSTHSTGSAQAGSVPFRQKGLTNFHRKPFLSKWLAETVVTLTPGPKITIPYNPLLFNKIRYNQPNINDLLIRAESYQVELKKARLNQGRIKTQSELARELKISKARLTQILNLLKLAAEIQDYLKNLNDPSLLNFFNEKRLRPIASIKDKQAQLEKFQELKGEAGFEESISKMSI
jgi:hypothetical protein